MSENITDDAVPKMGTSLTVIEGDKTSRVTDEWGLTAKQMGFARDVVAGSTASDAYRKNYDAGKMSQNVIWSEASKLMSNPRVKKYIQHATRELNEKHLAMDAKLIRRHVFGKLMEESTNKKSSAAARIRALELLGKMDIVGMFKDKPEGAKTNAKPEELEEQLREKLAAYLGTKK